MIKVDKSKTLNTKREKLLKELSLKVNQIRENRNRNIKLNRRKYRQLRGDYK